jgi:hypothetical protein
MRMAAFRPTRSPTGEVVKVGFGSNLAARFQARERPNPCSPLIDRLSREGLDFDESTAVDPTQKSAARAIPPQTVIRPQWQLS